MIVIFRGDPNEIARSGGLSRTNVEWYGLNFRMGLPVDVSGLSEAQKRKLRGNHHFEVVSEGVDAPAAPLVIPASAAAPVAADAGDEGGTEEAQAEPAAAKRKKA